MVYQSDSEASLGGVLSITSRGFSNPTPLKPEPLTPER